MEPDSEQDTRAKSKVGVGLQNSASQHVQGLSNFIKQINQTRRSDKHVNKSMEYLKKQ